MGLVWSRAEDRDLRLAIERSKSGAEIAKVLGRSRTAVYQRAEKLGMRIRSINASLTYTWSPIEDRKLRRLAPKNLGAVEVAADLSRSVFAVRERARKLGVVITPAPRPRHRVVLPIRELLRRFDRGCTVNRLAQRYEVDNHTVRRYLTENDRRPRSVLRHVKITQAARAVLDGTLLSDASLSQSRRVGRSPAFRLSQSVRRIGWLHYVAARLRAEGWTLRTYKRKLKDGVINGRRIRSGRSLMLESLNYVELKSERTRWYPKGKKRVPRSLRLTPGIVADWFCGDGTYGKNGYLSFCTNGFYKSDVEFLIKRLYEDLHVTSCLQRTTIRSQFIISVCRLNEAYNLSKQIRPHLPQCCLYKLKYVRPFRGRWPVQRKTWRKS